MGNDGKSTNNLRERVFVPRFYGLLFAVFAGCYFAFLQIFGILFGEELNI